MTHICANCWIRLTQDEAGIWYDASDDDPENAEATEYCAESADRKHQPRRWDEASEPLAGRITQLIAQWRHDSVSYIEDPADRQDPAIGETLRDCAWALEKLLDNNPEVTPS